MWDKGDRCRAEYGMRSEGETNERGHREGDGEGARDTKRVVCLAQFSALNLWSESHGGSGALLFQQVTQLTPASK